MRSRACALLLTVALTLVSSCSWGGGVTERTGLRKMEPILSEYSVLSISVSTEVEDAEEYVDDITNRIVAEVDELRLFERVSAGADSAPLEMRCVILNLHAVSRTERLLRGSLFWAWAMVMPPATVEVLVNFHDTQAGRNLGSFIATSESSQGGYFSGNTDDAIDGAVRHIAQTVARHWNEDSWAK